LFYSMQDVSDTVDSLSMNSFITHIRNTTELSTGAAAMIFAEMTTHHGTLLRFNDFDRD